MHTTFATALFLLIAAQTARTQSPDFSIPILGYVHDSETRSLRPIQGIPGAATIGPSLNIPFSLESATAAPRLNYALGRAADNPKLLLIRHLAGEPAWQDLDQLPADAETIAFSNSGRTAAVHSKASGAIHVIAGLPESAGVQRSIDTGSAQLLALAVNDTGRLVVAAFANDAESTSIVRLHDAESGSWKDLGPGSHVRSIAFAPNGLDIGIAADSPAAIWVIRDAASSAEWLPVAGESDGIISPTAIRFSEDRGLRIATATGVTLIQLSDNSRSDLRCGCRPTTLVEMETGSTYRLTQLSREPMWLLNESSEGPRLVFVPPVAAPQTTEGAQ